MRDRPTCKCLDEQYRGRNPRGLELHGETQDTECQAWRDLLELVEAATRDGRREFAPARELGWDAWADITTLPPSIAKLKKVKHLQLYGSNLVRIPPEIGEMTSMREFTPYTSYRLHWFPYEIRNCWNLVESTVSTRALYGNYKYRAMFPRLPSRVELVAPAVCSVCRSSFPPTGPIQRWISLGIATDVLPLLVHACSHKCLRNLPNTPDGYLSDPHEGGPGVKQPERGV